MGKNNIVYDNQAIVSPNISGSANFTYSCVGGGLPGTGNINANPLFIHTLPTGFCFLSQIAAGQSQNSPCVDAGDPASTMILGSTRTDFIQDAGVVDMGFHWSAPWTLEDQLPSLRMEFGQNQNHPDAEPENGMGITIESFPNPCNPSATLRIGLEHTAKADITIFDVVGRKVNRLFFGELGSGLHEFTFSGETLPAGMYFYRAYIGEKSITGRLLLVK